MKEAEAILVAATNEDKARITKADRQGCELREKLQVVETERGGLGLRLEQASQDIDTLRADTVARAAKEQVSHTTIGQDAILLSFDVLS